MALGMLSDIANTTCAIPLIPEDQDQFPYVFSIPVGVPTCTCHLSPVSGSAFSMMSLWRPQLSLRRSLPTGQQVKSLSFNSLECGITAPPAEVANKPWQNAWAYLPDKVHSDYLSRIIIFSHSGSKKLLSLCPTLFHQLHKDAQHLVGLWVWETVLADLQISMFLVEPKPTSWVRSCSASCDTLSLGSSNPNNSPEL